MIAIPQKWQLLYLAWICAEFCRQFYYKKSRSFNEGAAWKFFSIGEFAEATINGISMR